MVGHAAASYDAVGIAVARAARRAPRSRSRPRPPRSPPPRPCARRRRAPLPRPPRAAAAAGADAGQLLVGLAGDLRVLGEAQADAAALAVDLDHAVSILETVRAGFSKT